MTSPPFSSTGQHPSVQPLTLLCHPASPCSVSITLSCAVLVEHDRVRLRYELRGDTSRLRIPVPAPDGAAEGLWQHTCFEAFAMPVGSPAYQEFNFSPSGQWASYRFSKERVRHFAAEVAQQLGPRARRPQLQVERHADHLVLHASLAQGVLVGASTGGCLRLGLSAVVEDSAGQLSYWALHHPAAQPDFHHPGSFVNTLPWPTLP